MAAEYQKEDLARVAQDPWGEGYARLARQEMTKHEVLSPEEEYKVTKQLKSARAILAIPHLNLKIKEIEEDNAEAAREKMWLHNQALLVWAARMYLNHGLSLEELVQEGQPSLRKAIEKFDPDKGYKFSTYALQGIHRDLRVALIEKSHVVRIPYDSYINHQKTVKAELGLASEMGRVPTDQELADLLQITPKKVRETRELFQQPLSLNRYLSSDDRREEYETVADVGVDVEAEATTNVTAEKVRKIALEGTCLKLVEKQVISWLYGFIDGKPRGLEETGRIMGKSRQTIQYKRDRAILKIKAAAAQELGLAFE